MIRAPPGAPVFVLVLGLFPNRLSPDVGPEVPVFEPAFGNSEPVDVAGFAT
jgi:hypothetical protein